MIEPPSEHKRKRKDRQKVGSCWRAEKKKLWNMRMSEILITVCELETEPERLEWQNCKSRKQPTPNRPQHCLNQLEN